MYENSKSVITCPVCNSKARMFNHSHYECSDCNWTSLDNTVDISYGDPISSPLSNLFPHKFTFYTSVGDVVECLSMESFLQSLRVKDPFLQKYICENYTGYVAYKIRLTLNDWRKEGIVYWRGKPINRYSEEYTELITTAYNYLFEGNPVFKEIVLPKFKGKHLIHSFGCAFKAETLLTEDEYRYQLNRLMDKIK